MLSRERQQADAAEERAIKGQDRLRMEQERHDEHRQFMAAQREMLETVAQLVQRQNAARLTMPTRDANPQ